MTEKTHNLSIKNLVTYILFCNLDYTRKDGHILWHIFNTKLVYNPNQWCSMMNIWNKNVEISGNSLPITHIQQTMHGIF